MTPRFVKCNLTTKFEKHINSVYSEYSIDKMGSNGFATKPVLYKLKSGEKMMGFLILQQVWGQMFIKYLFVEKDYRGQGIGTLLLNHALNYAKKLNCAFIYLETLNFQAPLFYQKFGFEVEFKRDGYDSGVCYYYLRKNLNKSETSTFN